jgi:hypothetical protein
MVSTVVVDRRLLTEYSLKPSKVSVDSSEKETVHALDRLMLTLEIIWSFIQRSISYDRKFFETF